MGFKSPSTTAWIHLSRSRSRIANVTFVFSRIYSLQTPERDPETTRWHYKSGHFNLARGGHLNLAATSGLRIMYIMLNYGLESITRFSHSVGTTDSR
jgi:hypothetical protein